MMAAAGIKEAPKRNLHQQLEDRFQELQEGADALDTFLSDQSSLDNEGISEVRRVLGLCVTALDEYEKLLGEAK